MTSIYIRQIVKYCQLSGTPSDFQITINKIALKYRILKFKNA